MSPITTHVLDTQKGRPAAGVSVSLSELKGDGWQEIARAATNDDGRITDLLPPNALNGGSYQIRFDTGAYFAATGTNTFYPEVTIVFNVSDDAQHYHVPLLLSPFGYTTYRGS